MATDLKVILGCDNKYVLAICVVQDARVVRAAIDESLFGQRCRLRLIDAFPPSVEAANGYFDEMVDGSSLQEVNPNTLETVGLIFRGDDDGQEGV